MRLEGSVLKCKNFLVEKVKQGWKVLENPFLMHDRQMDHG